MHEPTEEPVETTQIRKIARPRLFMSRVLGEIEIPPPGLGPEPEVGNRLRAAFAEAEVMSNRFEALRRKMSGGK